MTKAELKAALENGQCMVDLLEFCSGQECEIFKSDRFVAGDEILYIPDLQLNEIHMERPITDPEELEDVLSQCYTGDDFLEECGGDMELAIKLFLYCDWQHPSSALPELQDDDDI